MSRFTHRKQQAQIKIAFHMIKGETWTVGPIYLRNLLHALHRTYGSKVKLFILMPYGHGDAQSNLSFIGADDIVTYNIPQRWTYLWGINKLIKHLLSRDMAVESTLRKHEIDALFGGMLIHKYPETATLSWLPDFQHIHLPEMFSVAERISRNQTFLQSAKLATRTILPNESSRKDFESFAPMYAHKVRILHPISYIPEVIYDYDLNSILNLYQLPKKFIYLPNQFWKHKNHVAVFKAVKILKERRQKVVVVCSGNSSDYRNPAYFAELWKNLSQWNIRDRVIYLGLIPREHVLSLIRQTIAVLNPSLFEGWGVTVDEAKSVGKQVLLSDIPAHHEQNPPKSTFFEAKDGEDLAEKITQTWENSFPGPDLELERKARENLPKRIRQYAESFMSVVREVTRS